MLKITAKLDRTAAETHYIVRCKRKTSLFLQAKWLAKHNLSVFKQFLKFRAIEYALVTAGGSSFQTRGMATAKARSPIADFFDRDTNSAAELEYRRPPCLTSVICLFHEQDRAYLPIYHSACV